MFYSCNRTYELKILDVGVNNDYLEVKRKVYDFEKYPYCIGGVYDWLCRTKEAVCENDC